jgi:hypothetical protein
MINKCNVWKGNLKQILYRLLLYFNNNFLLNIICFIFKSTSNYIINVAILQLFIKLL